MVETRSNRHQRAAGTSHRRARARAVELRWWIAASALIGLAVYLYGGYAWHWRWTGLSASVTLWDWLQVLALPVALGAAPLLLRHHHGLSRRHRAVLAGTLIVFGALVLAGYLVPLSWTGFRGNTLWNWLELILLPLVVATAALWGEPGQLRRPHLLAVAVAGVVFAVLVVVGYQVPLTWTGFRGNTAWDWIKLLLLPVLVPTVLLPLVTERLTRRLS